MSRTRAHKLVRLGKVGAKLREVVSHSLTREQAPSSRLLVAPLTADCHRLRATRWAFYRGRATTNEDGEVYCDGAFDGRPVYAERTAVRMRRRCARTALRQSICEVSGFGGDCDLSENTGSEGRVFPNDGAGVAEAVAICRYPNSVTGALCQEVD